MMSKERHGLRNTERIERGQQCTTIATEVFHKLARVLLIVRDIATPLAGDQNFCTTLTVLLQEQDPRTMPGGKAGSEEPRRAAADHNHIILFHELIPFHSTPVVQGCQRQWQFNHKCSSYAMTGIINMPIMVRIKSFREATDE